MKAVICHANILDTPSHTYITGPIHTKTMNMDKNLCHGLAHVGTV